MNLLNLYASFRQLAYPPALRIEPEHWRWSLLVEAPPVTPPDDPPGFPEKAAVDLGNQIFRLERAMAREAGADIRTIGRVVPQLRKALERRQVEVLDLKGSRFVVGRADFEVLGRPEQDESVSAPTIAFCERPAILVDGQLVQAARGVVSVPPEPAQSPTAVDPKPED